MNREHAAAIAVMGLFAIGAVAIIIYNHASATAKVLTAVQGGASVMPSGAQAGLGGGLGVSASLAGTPTIGQDGSSVTPAVVPLNIDPGYLLQ